MNFHQKALLIAALTTLLVVGATLWVTVFNKGTLMISGDPPYSVKIEGEMLKVPETVECTREPCVTKLPSGSYSLLLTKDGYFDETDSVQIERGSVATLAVEFGYIPNLESVSVETLDAALLQPEDFAFISFRFSIDPTYQKQRLTSVDLSTGDETVWAYFDRTLVDPVAFAPADLRGVLVADNSDRQPSTYWIEAETFDRQYLRDTAGFQEALWSDGAYAILLSDDALWLLNLETPSLVEWPFNPGQDQMVWNADHDLIFLSEHDISSLEDDTPSTLEVVKQLLDGELTSASNVAFSVGSYDVSSGEYRLLYEVPASVGLVYDSTSLLYDREADQLYLSDGELAQAIRFDD